MFQLTDGEFDKESASFPIGLWYVLNGSTMQFHNDFAHCTHMTLRNRNTLRISYVLQSPTSLSLGISNTSGASICIAVAPLCTNICSFVVYGIEMKRAVNITDTLRTGEYTWEESAMTIRNHIGSVESAEVCKLLLLEFTALLVLFMFAERFPIDTLTDTVLSNCAVFKL